MEPGEVGQAATFFVRYDGGDRCPHAGGIDQNIYGDKTP